MPPIHMSKNPSSRSTRWIIPGLFALILGIGIYVATHSQSQPSKATNHKISKKSSVTPPAPESAAPPVLVATPATAEASPVAADPTPTTAKDLPLDFLDRIVTDKTVAFILPDGRAAAGGIEMIDRDADGILFVQGRLTTPEPGFFSSAVRPPPGSPAHL